MKYEKIIVATDGENYFLGYNGEYFFSIWDDMPVTFEQAEIEHEKLMK